MSEVEVIPSLPAGTFAELKEKIGKVVGVVSSFQIDVADGLFVTNRSWPMNPGDKMQFENFVRGKEKFPYLPEMFYEVHFMAHNPEKLIPDWKKIGAERFLIHIEAKHDFGAVRMAAGECELGVSVNIGTPIERIDAYIEHISVIQLMGIAKIGIQGQPFDPRVIEMIREVRARYPSVTIEIDGAVNLETAPLLVAAGARRLAPGSYVLKSKNPKAAVEALRALPV